MTIRQVVRLLQRPIPNEADADAAFARLEAVAEPIDWPSPETSCDDDVLTAATVLFLQPARAERAKRALRVALGGEKFELLIGFMTFVRSAHYWTLMHPEIALEDDIKGLLREQEELARLLSQDAEAGRCEMGTRLFEELETLRNLHERQELEKAKRALEEIGRQKDLLLKEVDHRIKNSLQIVSSLLQMQAKTAGAAASQFHAAAARVAAIAAVHRQLHIYDHVGTVQLDQYLIDLCREISTASSSADSGRPLIVGAVPLTIATDVAVPLALIVNELVTNAIRHSRPVAGGGSVHVVLTRTPDDFTISVSDSGEGPATAQTKAGLGTRIIETLARQINATVAKGRVAAGYTITVTVPHHA
jgi:two-component sensor histidine kinase